MGRIVAHRARRRKGQLVLHHALNNRAHANPGRRRCRQHRSDRHPGRTTTTSTMSTTHAHRRCRNNTRASSTSAALNSIGRQPVLMSGECGACATRYRRGRTRIALSARSARAARTSAQTSRPSATATAYLIFDALAATDLHNEKGSHRRWSLRAGLLAPRPWRNPQPHLYLGSILSA